MLVLIDNYDSFTWNLAHRLGELGAAVKVVRNDALSVDDIEALAPDRLVISPGPGRPETAGISVAALQRFAGRIPMLGVCLGHQALAIAFGGRVTRATQPMHGKTSSITHEGTHLFKGLTGQIEVGRYHSLVIPTADVPPGFVRSAWVTGEDTVMAVRHESQPIFGVQFHPESVLTPAGHRILQNFLEYDVFADLLETLRRHEDLTSAEAEGAMARIMNGEAQPAHMAALLMALALKGERPAEMVGFARTMRARATPMPRPVADVFDTCGTGGDGAHTFNVSTAAAIVLAGAGVRVAKHGNRAVSSRSGSADVFEALGIKLDAPPDRVVTALEEANLGFFFAPMWHPSMKHAGATRKELGVRTAFNLLGPLTNPAGARRQVIGVSRPEHTELVARTLGALGAERAWVVHGAGGLDEISTLGHTKVSELVHGTVNTFYVHPSDVGLPTCEREALAGGTAAENAAMVEQLLDGERGPRRDIVLLNAAAALLVSGKASSLQDGLRRAADSLDSGGARSVLSRLREVCG